MLIKTRQMEDAEQIRTLELFRGAMAHEAKSPMSSFVMNNSILKDITQDFIVLEHDENNYKIQLSAQQYEMLKKLPDFNETIAKIGRVTVDLLLLAIRNDEMREVDDFAQDWTNGWATKNPARAFASPETGTCLLATKWEYSSWCI